MDCIIQARMNSTRLPNKIFLDICGKPVLQHVIERIQSAKLIDHIIIATTVNKCDDPIVELCQKLNMLYYRGSEQDVLDRYYQCAIKYNSKNIMRVTSDCPLIDPKIIDDMIDIYYKNGYDTLMPSYYGEETGAKGGFPDGCNPEIVSFKLLETVWTTAKLQQEREHVTKYIYTHLSPNRYKIFLTKKYERLKLNGLHLSLDTKDDYNFINYIYNKLDNEFMIHDVLELLNSIPKYLICTNKITYFVKIFKKELDKIYPNSFTIITKNDNKLDKVYKLYDKIIFFHWSYIVPKKIYQECECINIHTSNLPNGKGGTPLQNQIIENIIQSKVNLLRMTDDGLDAGPIYCSDTVTLQGSLFDIWLMITKISIKLISKMIDEKIKPIIQDKCGNVYKRRKGTNIEFNKINTLEEIYDNIRMLDATHYPTSSIKLGNFILKFSRASFDGDKIIADVSITKQL